MDDEMRYSVTIETEGAPGPDRVVDLLDALIVVGAEGPAASLGDRLEVRFSLPIYWRADDRYHASLPEAVVGNAWAMFQAALDKASLPAPPIAFFAFETEDHLEHTLSGDSEAYAGVTEIAELLGVSKQRVGQLRKRRDFPAPVADLAAGPVWKVSMLKRFASEWRRRPGRPPKIA